MFKSNNPLKQPTSKLAYGLAALAGAAILAGTVAVSAKTSSADISLKIAKVQAVLAVEKAIAFNARPLTISAPTAMKRRNIRIIKIFDVSEDQKRFAGR